MEAFYGHVVVLVMETKWKIYGEMLKNTFCVKQ